MLKMVIITFFKGGKKMRIDPDESYAIFVGPIFRNEDDHVPVPLSLRTAEIIKIENLSCIDDPDEKKFIMDLSFPNGDEESLESVSWQIAEILLPRLV